MAHIAPDAGHGYRELNVCLHGFWFHSYSYLFPYYYLLKGNVYFLSCMLESLTLFSRPDTLQLSICLISQRLGLFSNLEFVRTLSKVTDELKAFCIKG